MTKVRMEENAVPEDRDLVVVDLFCGAGGFSAGVHMSGREVVLAIDNNPHMLSLHQVNFGKAKHVLMALGTVG